MSELPQYRLERTFNGPKELVWRAWTDPDLLHRWYGPGVETIIHKYDLQPGGVWLNEMKWGDNSMYSKMAFQEVQEGEKMVWLHYSSTDAEWNSISNPMMPEWPSVLLTTVTFEQVGSQTKVLLTQIPHECSEAEISCFAAAMSNMDKGWGSGYAILDEMLEALSEKNNQT